MINVWFNLISNECHIGPFFMSKPLKVVVSADNRQRQVIARLLDEAALDCELLCQPEDCAQAPLCRWLAPERLNDVGRIASELLEAIHTLEQTRHAFRSKQLGGLRKRLQLLLESLPVSAR